MAVPKVLIAAGLILMPCPARLPAPQAAELVNVQCPAGFDTLPLPPSCPPYISRWSLPILAAPPVLPCHRGLQVVLMVVDVADFDGSLPRKAIKSLLDAMLADLRGAGGRDSSVGQLPGGFRIVVAVNKADLLPSQVTPLRLERWVRRRVAQGGLPRPSAVHVVSSTRRRGVRELLADLQAAVGQRGDVWVVGAQNAGKSSLINAMRQVGCARVNEARLGPARCWGLGLMPYQALAGHSFRVWGCVRQRQRQAE